MSSKSKTASTPTYVISLPDADKIFGAEHEKFPEIADTPQKKADYKEIVQALRHDLRTDLFDLTSTEFNNAERTLRENHDAAEYDDRFKGMMDDIGCWLGAKDDVQKMWA